MSLIKTSEYAIQLYCTLSNKSAQLGLEFSSWLCLMIHQ